MPEIPAEPYPFAFSLADTALVIIDMQRDFVEPGGFGETLGNDVEQLRGVIPPLATVLQTAREAGLFVIHTREGHLPTCPTAHRPSSSVATPPCGSATPAPTEGS